MIRVSGADELPWSTVIDDPVQHIRVDVRQVPGQQVREFRAHTRVQARLSALVALIEDTEHLPAWMHRVRQVTVLSRPDALHLHSYLVLAVPFPFHDRDVFMTTLLQQDAAGSVRIISAAEEGGAGACRGCVRMPQMRNEWIIKPLPGQWLDVTFSGFGVPGGVVPDWATNLVVTDLPFGSLRNLSWQVHRHKYAQAIVEGIREPQS